MAIMKVATMGIFYDDAVYHGESARIVKLRVSFLKRR